MSGIFPKAYNQLHLLQPWYFLCPVYTITASTEAVLPLSVSMNTSWHWLPVPLPHYKYFQPQRTTEGPVLLQYCIDCDKCSAGGNIHFSLHFSVIFVLEEITPKHVKDKSIC